jgi:hypothetical protein
MPTFAAPETAAHDDLMVDERLQGTARSDAAQSDRRRRLIDQPHGVRSYDGPADGRPVHPVERSADELPPLASRAHVGRHVRIDHGGQLRPPALHARPEPETLAGRMFRMHTSMAPHAALVGAGALILSGSLLYWLAFGPWRQSTSAGDASRPVEHWSSETTTQVPAEAPVDDESNGTALWDELRDESTAPDQFVESSVEASVSESAAKVDALLNAAETAEVEPSSAVTAAADAQFNIGAVVGSGLPITPTAGDGPYPTTPYAAFWFTATGAGASGASAAVAERPDPSHPNAVR